tara:strand:- start:517 stop:663 length:147 start_codon:yes stop_codon:yes gene_type:complete
LDASTSFLILGLAFGLGFLVYISLAILDLLDEYRLNNKVNLKGADISH